MLYTTPSLPSPPLVPVNALRLRLGEVRHLADMDRAAALVVAWSLLKAAARRFAPAKASRALTPAAIIEFLTSLGYIAQADADSLREAARARNLIVHGDVEQGVSRLQVDTVLAVVDALVGQLEHAASGAA